MTPTWPGQFLTRAARPKEKDWKQTSGSTCNRPRRTQSTRFRSAAPRSRSGTSPPRQCSAARSSRRRRSSIGCDRSLNPKYRRTTVWPWAAASGAASAVATAPAWAWGKARGLDKLLGRRRTVPSLRRRTVPRPGPTSLDRPGHYVSRRTNPRSSRRRRSYRHTDGTRPRPRPAAARTAASHSPRDAGTRAPPHSASAVTERAELRGRLALPTKKTIALKSVVAKRPERATPTSKARLPGNSRSVRSQPPGRAAAGGG